MKTIDVVERRAGDTLLVPCDDTGRAGARFDEVANVTTRAGVWCNITADEIM